MNVLLLESQSFGDASPGMIEKVEQQMVAPAALSREIGGRQDGLGFRHGQWLDQLAVKALERDGQHLAGQGQCLRHPPGYVAHKCPQGSQTGIAGAGMAAAYFFQVIEEA